MCNESLLVPTNSHGNECTSGACKKRGTVFVCISLQRALEKNFVSASLALLQNSPPSPRG